MTLLHWQKCRRETAGRHDQDSGLQCCLFNDAPMDIVHRALMRRRPIHASGRRGAVNRLAQSASLHSPGKSGTKIAEQFLTPFKCAYFGRDAQERRVSAEPTAIIGMGRSRVGLT